VNVKTDVAARFDVDTANHALTVLRDDGLYRHLHIAAVGDLAWNQWYEIVTYPGTLVYSGDMGTYVFHSPAILDVLTMFDLDATVLDPRYLASYLAKKCVAADLEGITEYSPDLLRQLVEEEAQDWFRGRPDAGVRVLRAEIADLLDYADHGEDIVREKLDEFRPKIGNSVFEFTDTCEWNLREFTHRFLWACHAITKANRLYHLNANTEEQ
jgi:hypothetical protein